jgi:cell division inhibitor SulA
MRDRPHTASEKSVSQELVIAQALAPLDGQLLTLAQIRELGQVSRWTVWSWCKGGLKTVHIGGVVRVRREDWNAFLEDHAAK